MLRLCAVTRNRQQIMLWIGSRSRCRRVGAQSARLTFSRGAPKQALQAAAANIGSLQGQRAAALAAQQAHLAWSGQALIANSLGLVDEAVDSIRAAFLLPQKELKCACRCAEVAVC